MWGKAAFAALFLDCILQKKISGGKDFSRAFQGFQILFVSRKIFSTQRKKKKLRLE